ncbi:MAG: alpha/beta fold hydrolase [Planctomycetota bacterium]|jgi:pimeloyl-ACP methyl ester carboxylesterase
MFVELARRFNHLGYPTLRFDLTGCGDSTGTVSRNDINGEVLDVFEASRFFMTKANLASVILFGISRGARVCYAAMTEHELPLDGMILLSMPVSGSAAALKSFGTRLREYLQKAKDPTHLRRLLSGRVSVVGVWRTLAAALGLAGRYSNVDKKTYASKCPLFFIYGGHDPVAGQSSRYYTGKCRQHRLACDCHFIPQANHSFFHYRWKEDIFDLSKQWLERISNQESK